MRLAAAVAFWASAAALAWTQVGYALALALVRLARGWPPAAGAAQPVQPPPDVSLIVAAHDEEVVIAGKVANALALDWPRDRLEIVVAVDGATDATAASARAAGADVVLDLPRGGKVRAQDAGVRAARGDLLAFSDANALWERDALARLVEAFADPQTGYACGRLHFVSDVGTNQEGVYWRYELWQREHESSLVSITAGNGAIYAVRRAAYLEGDPRTSHDLALPHRLLRAGWLARYQPAAHAWEKMVPSVEGEWARKRRMMRHAWPAIAGGGLLSPRGLPPLYAAMVVSHRGLRYSTPLLHAVFAAASLARLGTRSGRAAALAQALVAGAAWAGGRRRARPLLLARYYVLTTASIAAGLYDWLRHGTPAEWEAAEGTR